MKKRIARENPFKSLGVGYAHYLRNGAGTHQDKKKEQKRKECRDKFKASDWKSYFLAWNAGSGLKTNVAEKVPGLIVRPQVEFVFSKKV